MKKNIKEIAELLECEEACFPHEIDGSIEHYPDELDLSFADEFWKSVIGKIETDLDSYIKFEKMNSSQSFEIISDSASRIDSPDFRNRLEEIFNQSKPFRHFKHEIDNSDYRES